MHKGHYLLYNTNEKVVARYNELVSRYYELVSRHYEFVSHYNKLVSRYFEDLLFSCF